MPYKDPAKQREYQRLWCKKRRDEYFKDKFCVECGSKDNLELDHIDPSTKESHSIWSWSLERRTVELAKCQVLCNSDHAKKTIEFLSTYPRNRSMVDDRGFVWCNHCKEYKDKKFFHRNAFHYWGFASQCKKCRSFLRSKK